MVDFISGILNRLTPVLQNFNSSTVNIERVVSDLKVFFNNQNINASQIQPQAGGQNLQISLPNLASVLGQNVNQLNLKTQGQLPNLGQGLQNFKLEISGFTQNPKNPDIITLQGFITPDNQAQANTNNQKIPVTLDVNVNTARSGLGQNLAQQNSQNQPQQNNIDQVQISSNFRTPENLNLQISQPKAEILNLLNSQGNNLQNFNVSAKIISITLPNGEVISNNQNLNSGVTQVISGKLEFFAGSNDGFIRTNLGNFRLQGVTSIPEGSIINFTLSSATNEAEVVQNSQTVQNLRGFLDGANSPMGELLKVLNNNPQAAPMLQSLFPNGVDKQSYSKALWFISAANNGDADAFLGDEGVRLLQKTSAGEKLYTDLKDLFTQFQAVSKSESSTPNASGVFSSYVIPINLTGEKLEYINFYIEKDNQNNSGTPKKPRKFLVELEQNNLGKTVIEGNYTGKQRVDSLNIVLRTERPTSPEFQDELEKIFNDTAYAYNFNGSIRFLTSSTPASQIAQGLGEGIVI